MQMTLGWVLGAGGVALLVLGVALLAFWEVALFRITTFDHNFTGATCGTPLNNPGWATGSPCHGAVNRQTGAAWLLMTGGLASLVGVVVAAAPFQTRPHRQRGRPASSARLSGFRYRSRPSPAASGQRSVWH
jgi:hypothetical protein